LQLTLHVHMAPLELSDTDVPVLLLVVTRSVLLRAVTTKTCSKPKHIPPAAKAGAPVANGERAVCRHGRAAGLRRCALPGAVGRRRAGRVRPRRAGELRHRRDVRLRAPPRASCTCSARFTASAIHQETANRHTLTSWTAIAAAASSCLALTALAKAESLASSATMGSCACTPRLVR
jgi:hypothetical protein